MLPEYAWRDRERVLVHASALGMKDLADQTLCQSSSDNEMKPRESQIDFDYSRRSLVNGTLSGLVATGVLHRLHLVPDLMTPV